MLETPLNAESVCRDFDTASTDAEDSRRIVSTDFSHDGKGYDVKFYSWPTHESLYLYNVNNVTETEVEHLRGCISPQGDTGACPSTSSTHTRDVEKDGANVDASSTECTACPCCADRCDEAKCVSCRMNIAKPPVKPGVYTWCTIRRHRTALSC
eukprot:GEMP01041749.1.p1 GENE.GEMP01041749.1~~GEMP01041749.1.p1  ORF type:complete len:154 (+),score=29.23 GEMP01041749.1:221-682(+)